MLSTLSCVFVMLRLFHIKVDMETGELLSKPAEPAAEAAAEPKAESETKKE